MHLNKYLKSFILFLSAALFAFPVFAGELNATLETEQAIRKEKIASYQPRFGRSRPVIAVLAQNSGTELIDFVIPYGILSQSGAAQVLAVATQPGTIQMRPALRIAPQTTIDGFDESYPDGADYVIVPAVDMHKTDDPALLAWISAQAGKGGTVVSICDGALVVAKTGLFKGRRATGHWATQDQREKEFPDTYWVKNIRYVADGKMVSTSGVSAAIPASLALVEAIASTERATALAKELGVHEWTDRHDSSRFYLGLGTYFTAAKNAWLSSHHDIGVPVVDGVDEIALALTADAYSRTYRSNVYTLAKSAEGIRTRHGLTLLPDRILDSGHPPDRILPEFDATPSAQVLDKTLADIALTYGKSTASFVALQLEYPLDEPNMMSKK